MAPWWTCSSPERPDPNGLTQDDRYQRDFRGPTGRARNTARRDGGGVYDVFERHAAVRMNGHSVIASNTANVGGGIVVIWTDVLLHNQAPTTRNVAKSTGGGVLLCSGKGCDGKISRLVALDQAAINRHIPNNVVKRDYVGDCDV